MRIPRTLKVGGHKYKVMLNHKFTKKENLVGQARHMDLEIRLQKNVNKKKLEEIFLHEVIHCVDNVWNSQKMNERMVDNISEGLYQVLTDNKIF